MLLYALFAAMIYLHVIICVICGNDLYTCYYMRYLLTQVTGGASSDVYAVANSEQNNDTQVSRRSPYSAEKMV